MTTTSPEPYPKDDLMALKEEATTLSKAGEKDKAIPKIESMLAILTKRRGEKDEDTLRTKLWLHNTQTVLGDFEKAGNGFEELIPDLIEVFGLENPSTLGALRNQATCHFSLGKLEEAKQLFESLLELRERFNLTKDMETLKLRIWLAFTLFTMQDYKSAGEMYENLISDAENLLGPMDEETLISKLRMAICFLKLDNFEKALQGFQKVLEVRKELGGESHPATITARAWLAQTFHKFEKWEECVEEYRAIVSDSIFVNGPSHEETLTAIQNQAICSFNLKDYEAARKGFEQILELEEEEWKKQTKSLQPKKWLLDTLLKLGLPDRARILYEESLENAEERFGPGHESVLTFRFNYAFNLMEAGELDMAKTEWKNLLKAQGNVYDNDDPRNDLVREKLEETLNTIRNRAKDEL